MKKISILFVLMILITLSACSQNKLFNINYETYSSDHFKFVTEKESYSSEDTVIRYTITNISDEETTVNSDANCFELHRLVNGEWKRVGTKIDHGCTYESLILEPNQTETREIDLEKYYHLPLEKGKYRICIETLVSDTFEIF